MTFAVSGTHSVTQRWQRINALISGNHVHQDMLGYRTGRSELVRHGNILYLNSPLIVSNKRLIESGKKNMNKRSK